MATLLMLYSREGSVMTLTNIGDVIRQIEVVKCDRQNPPTPEQQETLNRILHNVYSGTVEFKGSR
jgi:hypothetical protein